MKVFIIATLTADGFIAVDDSHLATTWTTKADKIFFTRKTKEAGATVFGRKTFDTFTRALKDRRTIVMTSEPHLITLEGVEPTNESPADLVARLGREGVSALAVCGGASIYAQFLQADLVDEIYVNMQPVVFGTGVTLFNTPVHRPLELLDVQNIGDDTVALHYKVTK
nr:RibD C-terminal domain protein [uncultured bacterium]